MTITEQDCWAASLGGCGGGLSREHIISASQFDSESITMSGLPWCEEPKTVGLASLVAKNLCRDHNSALSPVDAEGARFKRAVWDLVAPHTIPIHRSVDARLVERWLLKTTINLALQQKNPKRVVTHKLARLAFGLDAHDTGCGFFFVAQVNEQITTGQGLHFETLVSKTDKDIALASFRFHGCRFIYAFAHAPPVKNAFRLREWNGRGDRMTMVWNPALAENDRVMPRFARPEP